LAFLGLGWRIRRQDRAYAPGNTAKKRRIRVICGANHAVAHTDKAAIAGGVCPVDGTGSGVIIFLEPVPKRFPCFGTGSPAYLFSKDIEQVLIDRLCSKTSVLEQQPQI
jgi:hypothetical protein